MTKYHDNDPHNATQEVLFGTEEELMADYYCEQAEEELKALQDHKPEHDHAPGKGDIFTCPACIINANR